MATTTAPEVPMALEIGCGQPSRKTPSLNTSVKIAEISPSF